jgi:hypothetical protein
LTVFAKEPFTRQAKFHLAAICPQLLARMLLENGAPMKIPLISPFCNRAEAISPFGEQRIGNDELRLANASFSPNCFSVRAKVINADRGSVLSRNTATFEDI